MIIKLHKRGRSFRGVVRYLTHDPGKAETSNRLAWTHTLNLANDHVPSAVDEMVWLYRSADQLKRAAGVATGGSKLERPVKHFSLSWHASQTPTREEMIEVTKRYLKHMGMEDRQAILVSHNDTPHPHVHVVVNVVSPVDGRAINTAFEYRRTQAFALALEREQGLIFCEERVKPARDREPTPARPAHEAFKQSEAAFDRAEIERVSKTPDYFERHDSKGMNGKEWEALKAYQRQQREQFFVDGKAAYRAARKKAYREVRQEFRGQWNAYYAAKRSGGDPNELAAIKAALQEAQKKAVDERRTAMGDELRDRRDHEYEKVLAQQQFDRHELGERQRQGLRTYVLFDVVYPAPEIESVSRDPDSKERQWRVGSVPSDGEAFYRSVRATTEPVHEGESRKPAVMPREGAKADAQPAVERTDSKLEGERTKQAQEMTDQRRDKDGKEATNILRASWNRHRSSRGGRD